MKPCFMYLLISQLFKILIGPSVKCFLISQIPKCNCIFNCKPKLLVRIVLTGIFLILHPDLTFWKISKVKSNESKF